MPILSYSITGDNSGLLSATNRAIANIENLTSAVDGANASLQFKNGISALDKLGQQLLIAQGNASLFGDSIKLQTQQLSAYQTALNSLLSNGFDPMGDDVQRLKTRIDDLTTSIKAVPSTLSEPGATQPSAENLPRNISGAVGGNSELVTALNAQLAAATISAQQYEEALLGANSAANTLGTTAQQTAESLIQTDGYLEGLKTQLASLNQQRIIAPFEDLAALNAEIQEVEISIQQATNIGKQGFDEFGNSIKGVSVQNINGQLISLSNNLFGARQIAKDVVRTFDAGSLSGFAKAIGLLSVDFLYYAQNAQFSAGATVKATAAIGAEAGVATTGAISTAALGAAFASLLTPVNLVILGIAVLGGGLLAYEKSQKSTSQAATEHLKALKEQKQALDDYISTLNAQSQVQAKAGEAISDETTKLNVLYDALQLQIKAGKDYTTQLSDLQTAFPQFFSEIDTASAKTNALADAYKNAGKAIEALGLVTAASQLAGGANVDQVKNQAAADSLLPKLQAAAENIQKAKEAFLNASSINVGEGGSSGQGQAATLASAEKVYNDILAQIQKYNTAVADARTKTQQFYDIAAKNQNIADSGKNSGLINGLQKQLDTLKATEPYLKTQQEIAENIAKQKAIQAELDALEGKNAASILKSKQEELTIQQQIAKVLADSGADAAKSGLSGYALQVQEITSKYDVFGVALDKIAAKIKYQNDLFNATGGKKGISNSEATADTNSLNSARTQIALNESKQLSDAQIADAQNTADAITKINNDFGVKQQAGYNEELARVKRLYDNIISSATGSALTLQQITENYNNAIAKGGNPKDAQINYDAQIQQAKDATAKINAARADLLPAIQAIDAKYIEQEQQTYDKINDIANQAFEALDDGETSRTDKINLEWQKRLTSANAYFDKLRDLAKASNLSQGAIDNINSVQSQVNGLLQSANAKQVSEEISKPFSEALQSSVNGFVSDFYNGLTSLGATREAIDEKYALQLSSAQDQATKDQINRIKQLELATTTSFGAIFSGLVDKFSSTFNESILNSFTKQLTENLGKTLITPNASQLTISPEEKSAQQVATLLKSAGTNLADQIKAAGDAFYAKVTGNTGLLSSISGGSSLIPGQTASIPTDLGTSLNADFQEAGGNLNDSITAGTDTFTKGASTSASSITAAGDHFSLKAGQAAAALSLAGGLVSGVTSPTSKVGQGIGKGLEGAGEGALIGSAIPGVGTLIGAGAGLIVGVLSGILGASKAQKELQQQQLEQQQEQTALLKASLAYTSSIIGRDTSNGIVTNISVGATGQLVASVSGKDLQFVLDRNANGR